MKLKVKPREAEIIRDALAARVTIMLTLGQRSPRNHEARKQALAIDALLNRLFPTEEEEV